MPFDQQLESGKILTYKYVSGGATTKIMFPFV